MKFCYKAFNGNSMSLSSVFLQVSQEINPNIFSVSQLGRL